VSRKLLTRLSSLYLAALWKLNLNEKEKLESIMLQEEKSQIFRLFWFSQEFVCDLLQNKFNGNMSRTKTWKVPRAKKTQFQLKFQTNIQQIQFPFGRQNRLFKKID
jgi:hypothetical protein